jgi:DNA-binding IclR family transcriptional regulator
VAAGALLFSSIYPGTAQERLRADAANRWACVEAARIGVASVAVPLFDQAGAVVAAAGICERTSRISTKALVGEALPRLTTIGRRVGEVLSATPRNAS